MKVSDILILVEMFADLATRHSRDLGPRVYLAATDRKALDIVSKSDLKRYAVEERRSG